MIDELSEVRTQSGEEWAETDTAQGHCREKAGVSVHFAEVLVSMGEEISLADHRR